MSLRHACKNGLARCWNSSRTRELFYGSPRPYAEISPKGTVPVLLLENGTVLEESMDIMQWALDESYFVGDWQQLVDGNDGDFKHHLDRYKYNNRYDNPLSPEEHRSHVLTFLEGYDIRLAQTSFLCGQDVTIADYALSPFVRQFANTDRAWFDHLELPHLHRWLNSMLEVKRSEIVWSNIRSGRMEIHLFFSVDEFQSKSIPYCRIMSETT